MDIQFPVAIVCYLVFSDEESDRKKQAKLSLFEDYSFNSKSRLASCLSSTLLSPDYPNVCETERIW